MIESEKLLERKLRVGVKKLGGWSIKMLSGHVTGLPDRINLLPGGKVFFSEIKTTKKNPSKIQKVVMKKLRGLGFRVEVIDKSEQIEQILSEYDSNRKEFT